MKGWDCYIPVPEEGLDSDAEKRGCPGLLASWAELQIWPKAMAIPRLSPALLLLVAHSEGG